MAGEFNNPIPSSSKGNGGGMLIGIVVAVVIVVLGLWFLSHSRTPADSASVASSQAQ